MGCAPRQPRSPPARPRHPQRRYGGGGRGQAATGQGGVPHCAADSGCCLNIAGTGADQKGKVVVAGPDAVREGEPRPEHAELVELADVRGPAVPRPVQPLVQRLLGVGLHDAE